MACLTPLHVGRSFQMHLDVLQMVPALGLCVQLTLLYYKPLAFSPPLYSVQTSCCLFKRVLVGYFHYGSRLRIIKPALLNLLHDL